MNKPDDALSLLKELVLDATVHDSDGVEWCFFCGEIDEYDLPLEHLSTCVWQRTKDYLRNLEGSES